MKYFSRLIAKSIRGEGTGPYFIHLLLSAVSLLYTTIVNGRLFLYKHDILRSRKLPCAVISIGNLAVGGTGKTPMTIKLADALHGMGFRVVVLSRGYRGTMERPGGLVSDGRVRLLSSQQAGDEPYLMAAILPRIPIIVGADRFAGGLLAMRRFKPEIILLDDAYQHVKLQRDLNLLLLDARSPFGNGYVLPRGPLREPAKGHQRADAVIFTRSGKRDFSVDVEIKARVGPRPIFFCHHRPKIRGIHPKGKGFDGCLLDSTCRFNLENMAGITLLGFSGLARNDSFQHSLVNMGGHLTATVDFEDHHVYSEADVALIDRRALETNCRYIVTSDKDYVRLPTDGHFKKDLIVMGVEIDFGPDDSKWQQYLDHRLRLMGLKKRQGHPDS